MSVTQYYSEYQRLIGEPRTLQEYRTLLTIFLKHRHNQHVSEIRALEAVIQEAHISWSELYRIYVSVERVAKNIKP